AISYLEARGKNYMLLERLLAFHAYTALKQWGYINETISVAHMALSVASSLDFRNIVFIGQDLAFAKDGSSHAKDYQNGENFESGYYEDEFEVEGYGGGRVKTHYLWYMFKHFLEKHISELAKKYIFFNATEGGVRVQGTIEKPFKECCEEFFTENKGDLGKLENLDKQKQNELLLKSLYKLYQAKQSCFNFRTFLSKNLDELDERMRFYANQINPDILRGSGMQQSIEQIMQIREEIQKVGLEIIELIQPLKAQFDLNLGRLVSIVVKDNETNLQKNLFWIKEHLYYFKLIAKYVKDEEKELQAAILKLENELKNRGLEKRVEKLKTKFKDKQC
ncbi:hypothetical protein CUPS3783_01100, partial [Campylobacter upsaliensis]|nr:hypothetical protein [Campylobacter upsaliensis]